ncbi:MAG: NAD-dependent epimerase/dehydratase family protein, partial [Oscillochloris sp.]|nr:NAD-dependent epimerase/dehydratase family protein [Oscillochloris sp.]
YQGHMVALMGRDFGESADLLAAGATPIHADLRDHQALIAACAGVDAVIHAGALSAPWGPQRDFLAINLGGTAALIAGCRRHRVARLVAISSPAVVFTGRDHILTTEAAPYPRRSSSIYAYSKQLAEQLVLAAPDLPTVILRPKAIFGPGDRALLPRIIAAARARRLPQIGHGRNLVDITYVENVAHAISLALHADAAVGRVYHITNGEHVALWELIRALLRRMGLSDRLPRVPLPLMLAAAGAMEARATLSGREPLLTRYSVAILARTQTYDISAAVHDLGYQPLVSVAEGVERTIARMKDEG